MYVSVPSKAMLDKSHDVATTVFDDNEPNITIDERLNDLRGSMDDFVRTGSLVSSSDCNSPPLLKKYEEQDFTKETAQQSTAKAQHARPKLPTFGGLILTQDNSEKTAGITTEACYRYGRPMKTIYVNLETGSSGTNQISGSI